MSLPPSNNFYFSNDTDNNSIPFIISKNKSIININGCNPLKHEHQEFLKEETRSCFSENSNSIVNETEFNKKRNFEQMNTTNIGYYNARSNEQPFKKRKQTHSFLSTYGEPVHSQGMRKSPTPGTILMKFFCCCH